MFSSALLLAAVLCQRLAQCLDTFVDFAPSVLWIGADVINRVGVHPGINGLAR
jgi:hypothetical protein